MKETVGFLIFNDVEELDLVGPWEVISIWKNLFQGPENLVTVSENGGQIKCARGLKIISDYKFESCPKLDYLVVPGGWGTRAEVNNKKIIEFIKKAAPNCKLILSVCTGAFLLQSAGFLDNKKATTHWKSLVRLREFKKTMVVEERIVKDGNIWTCGGISAGIDLSLALIAELAGQEVAGKVQFHMEYYPPQVRYGDAHLSEDAPEYLKVEYYKNENMQKNILLFKTKISKNISEDKEINESLDNQRSVILKSKL